MKYGPKLVVGLLLAGTPAWASVIFEADFESGTAANTGTIAYNAGNNVQTAVTGGSDATLGSNVLLADPSSLTGATATDITLTPTSAASLTGGQTAVVSLDVAWRRTNGTTKSHYLTGYDSGNNVIFQFVMADAAEFGNGSNDRQRPGYADNSGSYTLAGKIASGATPGSYWWGADTNHGDGLVNNKDAHFDLTIGSDGWTLYSLKVDGTTSAQTTVLPTYDGTTGFTELAYVKLTGESSAAGAYFDNLTIQAIPEPATLGLVAAFGGAILFIRRRLMI